MKKKSKYLILILTLVILAAIALLLYFFLIKNKRNIVPYTTPNYKPAITAPATSTPPDLSIMTKDEKIKLRVAPGSNVEVLRRNKDGSPDVYRIIK